MRRAPVITRGRDEEPGLLGANLNQGDGGAWRLDRVLPDESSDPLARPPLPPRNAELNSNQWDTSADCCGHLECQAPGVAFES